MKEERNFIGPLSPELMMKTAVVGHLTWGKDGSFHWSWYIGRRLSEYDKTNAHEAITDFIRNAPSFLNDMTEGEVRRFDFGFGAWTWLAWKSNSDSDIKVRMFERKWLDNQIKNAKSGILIEDKTGRVLFTVEDGGYIRTTSRIGNNVTDWRVRYIDGAHFEVNEKGYDDGPFNIYHRMQFGGLIPDVYTVVKLPEEEV